MLPSFDIWKFAFYARSNKNVDVNFTKLPRHITDTLIDFSIDVVGCYLPDDFLVDPVDHTHSFWDKLPLDNPIAEIQRRRLKRQSIIQVINGALWQALRTLRNYHFNTVTGELTNCTSRANCNIHVKWEHLKN